MPPPPPEGPTAPVLSQSDDSSEVMPYTSTDRYSITTCNVHSRAFAETCYTMPSTAKVKPTPATILLCLAPAMNLPLHRPFLLVCQCAPLHTDIAAKRCHTSKGLAVSPCA